MVLLQPIKTDLHSCLAKAELQRQLLTGEHIGIWSSLERLFHLIQLKRRECSPGEEDKKDVG